jgi:hypothetical protein
MGRIGFRETSDLPQLDRLRHALHCGGDIAEPLLRLIRRRQRHAKSTDAFLTIGA